MDALSAAPGREPTREELLAEVRKLLDENLELTAQLDLMAISAATADRAPTADGDDTADHDALYEPTRDELLKAAELLRAMVESVTAANAELSEQLDNMTIRALQAERHLREDEAYIASLEAGGSPAPAVYGWRRAADPLDRIADDMAAGRGAWAEKPVRGWRRGKTA